MRLAQDGGAAFVLLDPIAEEQARMGDVAGLQRTLALYAEEADRSGYLLRRAQMIAGDLAALDADPESAETIERAAMENASADFSESRRRSQTRCTSASPVAKSR